MQLAAIVVGVVSLAGCGGDEGLTSTDPQASVSGKVVYEGKPIPLDSAVVFYCADKGVTASGKVDSLGAYSLTGSIPALGIPAGRYQVMISPPSEPPPEVGDPGYEQFMMGQIKEPPRPKEIPEKFSSFATSKLVLEVKEGENTFDFDLAEL